MSDPFVGEIRMFGGNFAPVNWLACNGQTVPVSTYEVLYTLIGTTYGGDGINTFGIPDLRGRVPMGQGSGPGLTPRVIGQNFGTEQVSLTGAQSGHAHQLMAMPGAGSQKTSAGALLAQIPTANGSVYTPSLTNAVPMAPATVSAFGGGLPHENRMPLLCVTFIIATAGIFPSR